MIGTRDPAAVGVPAAAPPLPRERPRARSKGALAVVLLVPLLALGATELGAYASVNHALEDAQTQREGHRFAEAEAAFQAVAARGGPLYLLAHNLIAQARHDAARTGIDWAAALAAAGRLDEAQAVARSVSDPALAAQAHRTAAGIALGVAREDIARGRFDAALNSLDAVGADQPPADIAAQAQALRPAAALGVARAELAGGHAADAVATLDALLAAAATPAAAAVEARAALPEALLGAGRAALAVHDPGTALPFLQRLAAIPGSAPEAATARRLLHAPVTVTGTLVHADGTPAADVGVRLGGAIRLQGGGLTISPPYYYGRTDANGIFQIGGVPVGAQLVLQVNQGGWAVLTTRDSSGAEQPPDRVVAGPLVSVDLGFVREP